MKNQSACILPFTNSDILPVSKLARIIWLRQYSGLLSDDQIHYMLAQRYCPALIHAQLGQENIWWQKLVLDEKIIGFTCCMRTDYDALKVDKLYIHHDHHRKGFGRMCVDNAVKLMQRINCHRLILTVNKQNHAAIHAYRRYGFEICGDSVIDIGGGFFMNDYLMAMRLRH